MLHHIRFQRESFPRNVHSFQLKRETVHIFEAFDNAKQSLVQSMTYVMKVSVGITTGSPTNIQQALIHIPGQGNMLKDVDRPRRFYTSEKHAATDHDLAYMAISSGRKDI